jgi:hypothetical protein
VTTSIARKTTPPTTRRFDPGRHRLVRDRGGHRYTFGTLRLRAGKQARMGVGEKIACHESDPNLATQSAVVWPRAGTRHTPDMSSGEMYYFSFIG